MYLASGYNSGNIKLWDIKSGHKCLSSLDDHKYPVTSLVSLDNRLIISGSKDKTIKLWDLNSFECVKTQEVYLKVMNLLKLSNDKIACGLEYINISVYEIDKQENDIKREDVLWSMPMYPQTDAHEPICNLSVRGLTLVNDECFASTIFKSIKIWNSITYELKDSWNNGHDDMITTLENCSNNCIASGSWDKTIKIWDLFGNDIQTLKGHKGIIQSLCKIDDCQIASGSRDKTIKLWNMDANQCIITINGHEHIVTCIAKIENSNLIASGSKDGHVKLWDLTSGKCIQTFTDDKYAVLSLSIIH